MSTLITFVEPGMFTAVPAVITTRSPDATTPASRAAAIERDQRSSTSVVSGIVSGVTPHSSARCRRDSRLCVSATMARWGGALCLLAAAVAAAGQVVPGVPHDHTGLLWALVAGELGLPVTAFDPPPHPHSRPAVKHSARTPLCKPEISSRAHHNLTLSAAFGKRRRTP